LYESTVSMKGWIGPVIQMAALLYFVILSKNAFVVVGQWVAAVIVLRVSTLLEGVTADVEPCKQSVRSGIAVERR